jgi:hypothetical protein
MHTDKNYSACISGFILLIFAVLAFADFAEALPEKGATLPSFQLPAPQAESEQQYLGIKSASFSLQDVQSELLLVEIIGVYCPRCYQQAPLFSKLYTRIGRRNLAGKVKMLGIAAGATLMEVDHLRKAGSYGYPVVPDESFAVHKLLGEPLTPFTMLVNREGQVLYAHLGVIEDVDELFQLIQDIVQ